MPPRRRDLRAGAGEDGANVHALAGLARCYIETGAIEQAKQTLAMVPEPSATRRRSPPRAPRSKSPSRRAPSARSPNSSTRCCQSADHQARFDLAVALNAKGNRVEAVDHLIEIVRRDRKWNDDGARKQLVQFFEAWGPTDEATIAGRKAAVVDLCFVLTTRRVNRPRW
jgi:putative thioredoxin